VLTIWEAVQEIPIPDNPLKATNSYAIKSSDRNLIIDTGMNREECKEVFRESLAYLDIDLNKTDFFITHMHADHSGLISYLASDNSQVFCSESDAQVINEVWDASKIITAAKLNGFPLYNKVSENHPGYKYRNYLPVKFKIIKEDDIIRVGDFKFRCIETPGHTRGHFCLYEAEKKYLVTGDHLLHGITPNISLWSDENNPLKDYLNSLDKIAKLEVNLVLPGHRKLFKDHRKRIDELKQHHQFRNEEIINILQHKTLNAYQIASQMKWDINVNCWDDFPIPQKWFAVGEAIAHLKYLEEMRIVSRIHNNEIKYFLQL